MQMTQNSKMGKKTKTKIRKRTGGKKTKGRIRKRSNKQDKKMAQQGQKRG